MLKRILFIWLFASTLLSAQQTVGLFENTENAFDGYTLFTPLLYTETYLVDNCGRKVNSWPSNQGPGGVSYLLKNGNLLRTVKKNSTSFSGGGLGGRIIEKSWDNQEVWTFDYATDNVHQHHDIARLPNGNVLILAWERIREEEAIQNGRRPDLVNDWLWPDHIVEVQPEGANNGNIVWEWHFWDHLIQDFDNTKLNYGIVADHPERLDVNYSQNGNASDWLHSNAIAYNEDRDEIIISSRNQQEFYVIDHSTSTEQAAGSTGGNSGKGGDFLYRWGNPSAYQRGSAADIKAYSQHDVHWIDAGLLDAGKIMFYNNGVGRPAGTYSTVDIIEPPLDVNGNYVLEAGKAYGPASLSWTYQSDPPQDFFSSNISGAHRLANGNTLICEGVDGHIFEVDINGNLVWDYINPVANNGPISQGELSNLLAVFRAYRYGADYPAFVGKDLTPDVEIELNPLPNQCISNAGFPINKKEDILVFPNPFDNEINISSEDIIRGSLKLINEKGEKLYEYLVNDTNFKLRTADLPQGLYLLQLPNGKAEKLICLPKN